MNNPKVSVKVVSFDLWQTLIKGASVAGQNRATLLHAMLQPALALEEFTSILKEVDYDLDVITETNGGNFGPEERLDALCDRLDIERLSDAKKQEFYANRTANLMAYPPVLLDNETIAVLEELSQHYKLAIISNTGFINGAEMRRALDKIGILEFFTYQLFSNELGFSKPDRRIFEALIDQANVLPENIAHVGDNPRADVFGAQNIGMQGILRTKDTPLRDILSDLLTPAGE